VKERKSDLAQLETLDNGKPISEAEWDIVSSDTVDVACFTPQLQDFGLPFSSFDTKS